MAWIVTLKIVDCASTSTLLQGARISSSLLNPPGYVVTDTNGEAQIFDAYDVWEWVNLTISKSGTGSPGDADYDPGYLSKNFVIHMDMDGTVQTVCLNVAPPSDPTGTGEPISCFIVTAATGSAASFEVATLRELRERVRETSRVCGDLIDAVYDEYEGFSPPIANDLRDDARSRGLVRDYVVRPLFAWYRLAAALALTPADKSAHRRAAEALAEACPQGAPAKMIVGLLNSIQHGAPLPPFMPPMLTDLAPRIAGYHFAPWAILDALARTWRLASGSGDATAEVAAWLATAPIDRLEQPRDATVLAEELATLADFLAFAPDRRHRLGERLRAAWPDAEQELARAGLAPQTEALGEH